MNEASRLLVQLRSEESRDKQRSLELAKLDELGDAGRKEFAEIEARSAEREPKIRAALYALDEAEKREVQIDRQSDPEHRERIELRSRARLGNYLLARIQGHAVNGAEAEFAAACKVGSGIPIDLFEREPQAEHRAITPAAGTVGINMQPIAPAVFERSILANSLGVSLPNVSSGTAAIPRISGNLPASPVAREAAAPSTAGAISVATITPKRITGKLSFTWEDAAASGNSDFESALRSNLTMALSDAVDDAGLNGSGSEITGLLSQITAGSDPSAEAGFADYASLPHAAVDGVFATMTSEVKFCVNPKTMGHAGSKFASGTAVSAADYLRMNSGGFFASKRMPDEDATSKNSQILQARLMPSPMGGLAINPAVWPIWEGGIQITDIYSEADQGLTHVVVAVLMGNLVSIVYGDCYSKPLMQTSA